ncbi:hypothetical protein LP420_14235 [Massilia sp. B-10]|nr:hypothetical protein LP420_14235 [Massilia sp. B-10]
MQPYVRLLDSVIVGVPAGHCMLRLGHASSELWLVSLAVFWLPEHPRKAALVGAALLLLGFVIGWIQQLRGRPLPDAYPVVDVDCVRARDHRLARGHPQAQLPAAGSGQLSCQPGAQVGQRQRRVDLVENLVVKPVVGLERAASLRQLRGEAAAAVGVDQMVVALPPAAAAAP